MDANRQSVQQRSLLPRSLLILSVALAGCNQGPLTTYSAGGQVTFTDGDPLTGGMVLLRAVGAPEPVSARGTIQQDGTFELSTFSENDGAIEGEHQVALQAPPPHPGIDRDKVRRLPPPPFHEKYLEFETSDLTVNVSPKPTENRFSIELERAKRGR